VSTGLPTSGGQHARPDNGAVALAFMQALSGRPSAHELAMALAGEALRLEQDFALWELSLSAAGIAGQGPDPRPADRRGSRPGPRGQGRNLPAHRSTGPPARAARRMVPVSSP
jgi:hypothetical protein